MNIASKSLPIKIVTMISIIVIIVFGFLFVGQTLISYAIQTNGPNAEILENVQNNMENKGNLKKEISKEEPLYQENKSKLDVNVHTNNNAAIKEAHNLQEEAYINSLPIKRKAKEKKLARANILKNVSIDAAIRYASNIFSIIAIVIVSSYFANKRILKENIRF